MATIQSDPYSRTHGGATGERRIINQTLPTANNNRFSNTRIGFDQNFDN